MRSSRRRSVSWSLIVLDTDAWKKMHFAGIIPQTIRANRRGLWKRLRIKTVVQNGGKLAGAVKKRLVCNRPITSRCGGRPAWRARRQRFDEPIEQRDVPTSTSEAEAARPAARFNRGAPFG